MSVQNIGATLVKLAAVFIVILTIEKLPVVIGMLTALDRYSWVVAFFIGINAVLPFVIAWALWKFPHTVAGSGASPVEPVPDVDRTASAVLQTGIMLLGLYALLFGVIDMAFIESQRVAQSMMEDQYGGKTGAMDPYFLGQRLSYALQVLLGLALILRRGTIARWLASLKTAGIKQD